MESLPEPPAVRDRGAGVGTLSPARARVPPLPGKPQGHAGDDPGDGAIAVRFNFGTGSLPIRETVFVPLVISTGAGPKGRRSGEIFPRRRSGSEAWLSH